MNNVFANQIDCSDLRTDFESLEDKCLYYRSLTSTQKLTPNSYVMLMLDGHTFSSKIKKRFKLPFDDLFIKFMNETAAYVCSEVQGAKIAFVQSDEISILLTDFETEETSPYFDYRLCKILSIVPSIATAYFNRAVTNYLLETPCSPEDMKAMINDEPLYQFDCKCWVIPDTEKIEGFEKVSVSSAYNNVFAWFLYRQIDNIRNSKNQAAQTYCSHKELQGKSSDEALKLLKQKTGIDWYTEYDDGKKYGRFIYKEKVKKQTVVKGKTVEFERSVWTAHNARPLTDEDGQAMFKSFSFIPIKKSKTQTDVDRDKLVKQLEKENHYKTDEMTKLCDYILLCDYLLAFYDMCARNDIFINLDDIHKVEGDEKDSFVVIIKNESKEKYVQVEIFSDYAIVNTNKLWSQIKNQWIELFDGIFDDEIPEELKVPLYEIKNNKQYTND